MYTEANLNVTPHPVFGGGDKSEITIRALPCQHWCKRTPFDLNQCLWCSWQVRVAGFCFYFGGDTGYCGEVFRAIRENEEQEHGKENGRIDLAFIPIGAEGHPAERWFHAPNHMSAAEAVDCHNDLNARLSVGIHWGTFPLTGEGID